MTTGGDGWPDFVRRIREYLQDLRRRWRRNRQRDLSGQATALVNEIFARRIETITTIQVMTHVEFEVPSDSARYWQAKRSVLEREINELLARKMDELQQRNPRKVWNRLPVRLTVTSAHTADGLVKIVDGGFTVDLTSSRAFLDPDTVLTFQYQESPQSAGTEAHTLHITPPVPRIELWEQKGVSASLEQVASLGASVGLRVGRDLSANLVVDEEDDLVSREAAVVTDVSDHSVKLLIKNLNGVELRRKRGDSESVVDVPQEINLSCGDSMQFRGSIFHLELRIS